MLTTKLKAAVGALVVIGAIGAGAAVHAYQSPPDREVAPAPQPSKDGAEPEVTAQATTVRAYYVGDLLVMKQPADAPIPNGEKPALDMTPIIELITSTVAPGTWAIGNDAGEIVKRTKPKRPTIGSITPFYLSVSVIVRHDAETHETVSDLLRNLRKLRTHWSGENREPSTSKAPTDQSARTHNSDELILRTTGDPRLNASLSRSSGHSQHDPHDRPRRVRQLLNELKQEIDVLMQESVQTKATTQVGSPPSRAK